MPTESALEAVRTLRDGSLFQWPLLAPVVSVYDMKTVRPKAITVAVIFGVDVVAAILFGAILGWI